MFSKSCFLKQLYLQGGQHDGNMFKLFLLIYNTMVTYTICTSLVIKRDSVTMYTVVFGLSVRSGIYGEGKSECFYFYVSVKGGRVMRLINNYYNDWRKSIHAAVNPVSNSDLLIIQ